MTTPLSVLLVDDSTFFIALEKQFLKKLPVAIHEARSAQEALSLCREQQHNLVYMAFDLEGAAGADCCRQIKADPALRDIPVIMLYDAERPEQLAACRRAGCNATLTKPIDRHEFVEAGRKFLPGIRERRQPCLLQLSFQRGGQTCSGKCLDLSTGGLFVESSEEPAPGESLRLEFQLPGQPPVSVACSGSVSWLNSRGDGLKPNYPVGFGVKFTEMPKPTAQSIREYLGRKG